MIINKWSLRVAGSILSNKPISYPIQKGSGKKGLDIGNCTRNGQYFHGHIGNQLQTQSMINMMQEWYPTMDPKYNMFTLQ